MDFGSNCSTELQTFRELKLARLIIITLVDYSGFIILQAARSSLFAVELFQFLHFCVTGDSSESNRIMYNSTVIVLLMVPTKKSPS